MAMARAACVNRNVGSADRIVRIVVGIALIVSPALFGWSLWPAVIAAAIGGAQVLQGLIGY